MGRKIKHYSSGYQIRRKKQRRMISSILFVLLLAVLVFVGYAGAKALSEMRTGRSEIPSTLSSEQLPEDSSVSESGTTSSNPVLESSDLPLEELPSEPETSSEVETLYTQYGVAEKGFTPVKENPFTRYGIVAAAYTPLRETPKTADNE